jgi:DNA-binding MltR family transcriptional regulator
MAAKGSPLLIDFQNFLEQFITESDRAAVIIGAAKIEYLLGELLDKYLLPASGSSDDLLEGDAPLATFSAKIKICFRLGLIDARCTKLLHTFRRLRNGFAHEVAAGNLNAGAAKDRVIALADPFSAVPYFQESRSALAKHMKLEETDAGVVFRTFLAMIHIYLANVHDNIGPLQTSKLGGIEEFLLRAPTTEQRQKKEVLAPSATKAS